MKDDYGNRITNKKNKLRTKTLAMMMVAVMMIAGFVALVPAEQNDADETPTFKSLYPGSWAWNSTTGYGPFNSFYAAFDMNDGNKFVSILNPNDLSKKIDGTSLGTGYNIMWVLPTVYWLVDQNGDLTITNDSTAGGTAYAHTIDGHVYAYVAYAVHEAGTATVGGSTVITSEPNVVPAGNMSRATIRTYAHNYTMDSSLATDSTNHPAYSMLWNFYQWELYKYCCFAVMEDFNAQNTVGNGHVFRTESSFVATTTGATDSMGPYAGNPGLILTTDSNASAQAYGLNSVKLFIENAWGGSSEWVDGILYNNGSAAINTNHTPDDTSTSGTNITTVSYTFLTGYPNTISTDIQTWGMGTNTDGSSSIGLTDNSYGSSSSNRGLTVGGGTSTSASGALQMGLSCVDPAAVSMATNFVGRLTFVYDAGPASAVSTPYSYTIDYDSSAMNSGSAAISVEGMDPISHNAPPTASIESSNTSYGTVSTASITDIEPGTAVTIDGATLTISTFGSVTATPAASDAQYTYAFTGWYVNDTQISTGYTIDSDVTIEARFTQTLNNYTVTIQSSNTDYGTVSPTSVSADYGTSVTISNNVLTIGSTPVTATATSSDAQYTYAFTGFTGITDGSTISGNVTATANFIQTLNTYTITWVNDDNTVLETDTGVAYGTTPSYDGATPTKTATAQYTYTFDTWTPAIATVTGNQTYTATYTSTVNEYTITWVIDETSEQETYEYGETPTHEDPVKEGYLFTGWDPSITPVTQDQTYTATFGVSYTATLRYDANKGTDAPEPQTYVGTSTSDHTFTIPDEVPYRVNYDFSGWAELSTATQPDYFGGDTIDVPYNGTVTLYAVWEEANFSVIFNPGHGAKMDNLYYYSSTDQTHTFTIPDDTPTWMGHDFLGWSTTSNGSVEYVSGDTVTVNVDEPLNLYGVWERNASGQMIGSLLDIIPLLMVVGLILGVVGYIAFKRLY